MRFAVVVRRAAPRRRATRPAPGGSPRTSGPRAAQTDQRPADLEAGHRHPARGELLLALTLAPQQLLTIVGVLLQALAFPLHQLGGAVVIDLLDITVVVEGLGVPIL
jgi:hypothetical protein